MHLFDSPCDCSRVLGVAVDGAELSSLVKLLVEAANQGSLAEVSGVLVDRNLHMASHTHAYACVNL